MTTINLLKNIFEKKPVNILDELRISNNVNISGFKNPQLVMQSGRSFMVVKEGKEPKTFRDFKNKRDWTAADWKKENEKTDIGIVFTKDKLVAPKIDPSIGFKGKIEDDFEIKMDIKTNITDLLYKKQMLGGNNDNYYNKYIKYKTKYIELKKSIKGL